MLDFLGNAWSLWPPSNEAGGLNIASGIQKMSGDILSVMLLRPGEDPIHPASAIAPDLFESTSGYNARVWVYEVEQRIKTQVAGIDKEALKVGLNTPDRENSLQAYVSFSPLAYPSENLLTFGWYAYTGAIWNQDLGTFLDSIQLNGRRFAGLLPR